MARNIFSHHYDHCHLNEEEFLRCCLQDDKLCKILVPNVFRIPKPLEEKHRPLLRWKRIRSNLGPGLRQNFGLGKSSCTIFHPEESKFVFPSLQINRAQFLPGTKMGFEVLLYLQKLKIKELGQFPRRKKLYTIPFINFHPRRKKGHLGSLTRLLKRIKAKSIYLTFLDLIWVRFM